MFTACLAFLAAVMNHGYKNLAKKSLSKVYFCSANDNGSQSEITVPVIKSNNSI